MRVSNDRAEWLAENIFPHEAAIRAWLKRRVAAGLEIDDVIHDLYARLVALPEVDHIRQPRQYAFRIAYSITVDHMRRARIVPIASVERIEDIDVATGEPSAEQQLLVRDDLRRVREALASLPPLCRQAFLLRREDGLSQRETANRLGISEKTVEKYMTRSVRLIMDVFGRGGKSTAHSSYKSGKQLSNDVRAHKKPAD